MPDRAVAVELTIAAPFADVWRALRDPAEIRRWHGWEYDGDGGLDGEIEIIYVNDVEVDEAAGTIAIADGSRFELEDRGGKTVVRVTMPAPADGASWDDFYADVRFATPGDLERFCERLAEDVAGAAAAHGATSGRPYRLVLAGHPTPATEEPDA